MLAGPEGYDSRQRDVKVERYTADLDKGARGLRIGLVREGFGAPDSEPDVDEVVREAASRFEGLGASVKEVSVPWHLTGLALWGAITLEGTVDTVSHGNGFAHGPEGLYLPSMIKAMTQLRLRAHELPFTIATGLILDLYAEREHHGHYYAKAQNLRWRLRAAYDQALGECDILLMPTTRMKTSRIPPADAGHLEVMKHSWEMIGNTCPLNVSGHPAISIPWAERGEAGRADADRLALVMSRYSTGPPTPSSSRATGRRAARRARPRVPRRGRAPRLALLLHLDDATCLNEDLVRHWSHRSNGR